MKFLIITILFFSFLIGCTKEDKETTKEDKKEKTTKTDAIDKEKKEEILRKYNTVKDSLAKVHSAVIGLDTLDLPFSYHYQEIFKYASKPVIFGGEINDAFYKGENAYVFLECVSFNFYLDKFLVLAKITKEQFDDLFEKKYVDPFSDGIFVVKITKATPVTPNIKVDKDDENVFYYLDYSNRSILFEGVLVDFYIFTDNSEENE